MVQKFQKGLSIEGPSFIHVPQPCFTGWRFDPRYGIKIGRLAIETAMWINWEIVDGEFRVTVRVPKRKHVRHYLSSPLARSYRRPKRMGICHRGY